MLSEEVSQVDRGGRYLVGNRKAGRLEEVLLIAYLSLPGSLDALRRAVVILRANRWSVKLFIDLSLVEWWASAYNQSSY